MVAAVAVDVSAIGTGTNLIPAGNLQDVLSTVYGKAVYAADNVGAAIYKADQANLRLDVVEGTANYAATEAGAAKGESAWAAQKLGALHYHLQQIGGQVGHVVPDLADL